MTLRHLNTLFLLLFLGSAVLHAVWLSQLAKLLQSVESDSSLIAGVNQLASSGDGEDGANYRRAIAYVLGRKYRKYGDAAIRRLGDRILVLMAATALLCLGGVVLMTRG